MLGVAMKFLSPFMPYMVVGLIATSTIMTLMWKIAESNYDDLVIESATKIERAALNVANMEKAVEKSEVTITQLLIDKVAARVKIQQQDEFAADLQMSLNEERQRNESYKTRWGTVAFKRPTLLARLANRATSARVRLFATITCRGTNCDGDGDSDSSRGAAEETGSNSRN
jgi:hypothetical protein